MRAIGGASIELDELTPILDRRGLDVAADHPCLLDALMLLSRLPDGVPLMKAELEGGDSWARRRIWPATSAAEYGGSMRVAGGRIAAGRRC